MRIPLGYQIFAFDGSAAAHDSRKYGNRRAEVWAKGKFWLESGAQIPDDDGLAEQITGPHFYYRQGQASHGAIMIERKEDMGKRGLESPDRADTLMLTHAVNSKREVTCPAELFALVSPLTISSGSTLIATSRPSRVSRARYTSPLPPAPSGSITHRVQALYLGQEA